MDKAKKKKAFKHSNEENKPIKFCTFSSYCAGVTFWHFLNEKSVRYMLQNVVPKMYSIHSPHHPPTSTSPAVISSVVLLSLSVQFVCKQIGGLLRMWTHIRSYPGIPGCPLSGFLHLTSYCFILS